MANINVNIQKTIETNTVKVNYRTQTEDLIAPSATIVLKYEDLSDEEKVTFDAFIALAESKKTAQYKDELYAIHKLD